MSTSKTPAAERAETLTRSLDLDVQAQVFATLALAEAIDNLTAELRGLATEAQPLHVREA